jgi:hypothetical protein
VKLPIATERLTVDAEDGDAEEDRLAGLLHPVKIARKRINEPKRLFMVFSSLNFGMTPRQKALRLVTSN